MSGEPKTPYRDSEIDECIDTKLRKHAMNGGSFELAVLVADLMGDYPERHCDAGLRHRFYRDWLSHRCKNRMKQQAADQEVFDLLGFIPPKCRSFLSKRPAWFFNRRNQRYEYLIKAKKEAWAEAIGIRMDMTEAVAAAADPYREGFDLLEAEGVNSIEEWIKREQKRPVRP